MAKLAEENPNEVGRTRNGLCLESLILLLLLLLLLLLNKIASKLTNITFLMFNQPRTERLRWSRGSVLPLSTQVRGFKPGQSRQDFSGRKNPFFLRKGSKAAGPMSQICGM